MNKRYRRSPHTVYEVKYHFVFCPKYRYGVMEGKLKKRLQEMINEVCNMLDIEIVEGRVLEDHVHVCLSVPPKYSPAEVMKRIKGNSSERLFREFPDLKKRYWGQHFWARGYFVSTVGADEETIKRYIKEQKSTENQLRLWE
jgi:putative transposase